MSWGQPRRRDRERDCVAHDRQRRRGNRHRQAVDEQRTHRVSDVSAQIDDEHDLQIQAHPMAELFDLVRALGVVATPPISPHLSELGRAQ